MYVQSIGKPDCQQGRETRPQGVGLLSLSFYLTAGPEEALSPRKRLLTVPASLPANQTDVPFLDFVLSFCVLQIAVLLQASWEEAKNGSCPLVMA